MARKTVKNGILRGCPTCGTKVDTAHLGLRDFAWVNEVMPGKVGGMDFDFVLTQHRTGRMLVLEMKPKGAYISTGARLSFSLLVSAGYDVWLVWEQGDGTVKLAECNDQGRATNPAIMTEAEAAALILHWWESGLEGSAK